MEKFASSSDIYLSGLIAMIEQLNEPWGIKDLASRHVYMNKAAYFYTNTPLNFAIEGKLDDEFPAEWAELAPDLKEHDRRAEAANERVTVIETHYWYGETSLMPFISEKLPIYNEQRKLVGTLWNARKLNTLSPLLYINQKKPSVLTTECNNKLFTQAELDIIFFMLQRHSTKEIANLYKLSAKTIENRIYNIYQKAGVHTLQQFTDFCRQTSLDNYVPLRLLKKGILFL
ncbi:regulatory LuxR family protein [Serratia fonticola]|jgi:DNA-binding CsgD family transcriptional regulator|uniref:Regulatory LuxR family protein n=1 Tax=Serratia fonticola TaxID=47917 RepID=A0A559TCG5_SERFO|nr:LuxR C-terminal-related transcriptional regulator [Serratia fonticola]TQI80164.1 regulatory LuxR family protein [Serratia fonticola]TQI97809.1 regulatory LuxR family protein [Serratia fonticola]TVZ72307.1 regulatory LuxR family protein [Serratia fonticola]